MAISKAYHFDENEHHFSLLCKALGHPARIRIITKLYAKNGEFVPVQELYENMPLQPSTISGHIQHLRKKGILIRKQEGDKLFYNINYDLPNALLGVLYIASGTLNNQSLNLTEELNQLVV